MKKTGFPKREGMETASPLISVAFFKSFSFVMLFKRVFSSFMSLPSICTSKPLIKLRNVFKQSTIHFIFLILLFMLYISSNMFLFLQKQVMQTLISFFLLQARPSFLFLYIISSYYHFVYALFKPLI